MAYAENQVTIEIVNDGFSPIVEVDQSDNAATITVTDVTGTKTDVVRKRQVFVTEPTTPYSVGDLWVTAGGDQEIVDSLITDEGDFIIDSAEQFFEVLTKGVAVYVCMTSRPSGAFVESDWSLAATDNTSVNELREWFWHDANGAHVLGDATGFRNDITSTGMKIIDTSAEDCVAEFGSSGAVIGRDANGQSRSELSANGMQIVRKASNSDLQIANIGFGETVNGSGVTTDAPFYTFGLRQSELPAERGSWSFAEGIANTAVGFAAHAEGDQNVAYSNSAHVEGTNNQAGESEHVNRVGIHAEGLYTRATGEASHSQNYHTIADYQYQTAIGKFNDNQSNNAFEIGNGNSTSGRSNAFAVDWDGNIYPNNVKMADFVIEQDNLTGTSWFYRKWKSGKIEAWFSGSVTSATGATEVTAPIYRGTWSLSIPSQIGFASAPHILITNNYEPTNVISINGKATSATAISGNFFRVENQSGTITLYPRIYAWGVTS